MYYEDKGFRIELVKHIQKKVDEFFLFEISLDAKNEQLIAIGAFNLNQLAGVRLEAEYYLEDFKISVNKNLRHLFSPPNEHDRLVIRMEQLNLSLISEFGKDTIDEMRDDIIAHLLESRASDRYSEEFNRESPSKKKGFLARLLDFKGRKRKKEQARINKKYHELIRDFFFIYPVLWMLPFLNRSFKAHAIKDSQVKLPDNFKL